MIDRTPDPAPTNPIEYLCLGTCGTLGEFRIDSRADAQEGLRMLYLLTTIARCTTCGSMLGVKGRLHVIPSEAGPG